MNTIDNYIKGNASTPSGAERKVYSPIDGAVLGIAKDSTIADVSKTTEVAVKAQQSWAALTTKKRVEVHYAYRNLLIKHRETLAEICHLENGKTMAEALAGADKAIELTEYACSMPQLISGEVQEVSTGIECKTLRRPLGVVASISPFNFPIMVPHWTIPNALATGNAILLKPSELTPLSAIKSAELWTEAGLPDGLCNVVLGAQEAVEALCDEPKIQALTFVGSTPVAQIVYRRASQALKRVGSFGGAKNYLIITEDAHPQSTKDIMSAFCGMAGQRCMAASVLIMVGKADKFLDEIVSLAKTMIPGKSLPPLVTQQAVDKVGAYLDSAKQNGATLLLDGRTVPHQGKEGGYHIGASIIDWRGKEALMPLEEIFGPTLEILHADTLEEAMALQNNSPYGNAAAIFTQSGRFAQEAGKSLSAGMIGVNIGIPVPREPFSFGGINHSRFGQGGITGWSNIELFTDEIKITTKWNPADKKDWMS